MNDTFCIMPFLHLNLKQEGRVCACWRSHGNLGNSNTQTLTEIYNGEEVRVLRKSLINGEMPESCRSCWDMEKSNIESTRLQTLKNWTVIDNNVVYKKNFNSNNTDSLRTWIDNNFDKEMQGNISSLKSIEIRFDNVCNLMCRHCSPVYSSMWENAVKKDNSMMKIMEDNNSLRKNNDVHLSLNDSIINEINVLAPHLQEIIITGGEPLYHKKHYSFLKNLEPYAENIILNYNSNFSTLTYNNQDILPLWEKFKRVGVLVSIDATPEIYSYVRVKGDIKKVEENIESAKRLKNIYIQGTCTTSILNITRIVEVFKYFLSLKIGIHASIVQWPTVLNPCVLPLELKQQTTKKFNEFIETLDDELDKHYDDDDIKRFTRSRIIEIGNKIINYMNSKDMHNENWKNTIHFIKIQDKFNKTNFIDLYPEFEDYWK